LPGDRGDDTRSGQSFSRQDISTMLDMYSERIAETWAFEQQLSEDEAMLCLVYHVDGFVCGFGPSLQEAWAGALHFELLTVIEHEDSDRYAGNIDALLSDIVARARRHRTAWVKIARTDVEVFSKLLNVTAKSGILGLIESATAAGET
jgi:hypothetical protein